MEGGWERPHNRARTLGECDGNDEGNKDDDKEYGKDGNIPDDDDKYAGGRQTTKNTQQPTKNMRARRGRDEI
jgi:hypothetical protein